MGNKKSCENCRYYEIDEHNETSCVHVGHNVNLPHDKCCSMFSEIGKACIKCEYYFGLGIRPVCTRDSSRTINNPRTNSCSSFIKLTEPCELDSVHCTTSDSISSCLDSMKELLLEKNRRYGDSALKPKRIFSKLDANEGIKVRLDDKINRLINSKELRKNDVADLMGYLTLLCVANGWTDFNELID